MITLPYICYRTSIRQLMQAGIVPDWMYEDCDRHGMDTAEDFLCEWDWGWNWDLGKGYSKKRLEILAKARQIVKDGIEEFERNPELQKMEKARVDKLKRKKELSQEFHKKFCPPFYAKEIAGIVDYTVEQGEEPFFIIFYCWYVRHRHSDRNKIRFIMAGIEDSIAYSPQEIVEMTKSGELKEKFGIETEFTLKQLQRFLKTPCEVKGKLDYLIPAIKSKLPEYLKQCPEDSSSTHNPSSLIPSPEHPVWQKIMEREPFRFKPEIMSRALSYFLS